MWDIEKKTKTHAYQRKCFPTSLALTQPCYSLNNFIFPVNSSKTNLKFEKKLQLICRAR